MRVTTVSAHYRKTWATAYIYLRRLDRPASDGMVQDTQESLLYVLMGLHMQPSPLGHLILSMTQFLSAFNASLFPGTTLKVLHPPLWSAEVPVVHLATLPTVMASCQSRVHPHCLSAPSAAPTLLICSSSELLAPLGTGSRGIRNEMGRDEVSWQQLLQILQCDKETELGPGCFPILLSWPLPSTHQSAVQARGPFFWPTPHMLCLGMHSYTGQTPEAHERAWPTDVMCLAPAVF